MSLLVTFKRQTLLFSKMKLSPICLVGVLALIGANECLLTITPIEDQLVCPFREFCYVNFAITDANGDSVEDASAKICKLVNGKQSICKDPEIDDGVYTRKIGGPDWKKASFTEGEWILVIKEDGESIVSDPSVLVNVPPIKIVAKEEDVDCEFKKDCFVKFAVEDRLGDSLDSEEAKKSAQICKLVDGNKDICKEPIIDEDGFYTRKIGGPNWKQASFTEGEWILVMDHEGEEYVPVRSAYVTNSS